ncbi:malonate decarboxylase holo-[acyl-carrier-protein] synthase [Reyranella sp.]|jgi:phosphoribosyl-dephospho-CoA transferase|uniref:malonate decarboxylase holo-[acyl-carrier-protein] synthase n=1 Tax=Reyranella sp. TaxID=1929291 RepID=UPI003D0D6126
MKRHELFFIRPASWGAALAAGGESAAGPLVAHWVDNGWPLIGRRPLPGEGEGVPLGLPLPPAAGKRRLSYLMPRDAILATTPPPCLRVAGRVAPCRWWGTLDRLEALAIQHGVQARVFGSLAWRALTGLDYLTAESDLDLLLQVRTDTDLSALTTGLAEIERLAPMRIDGELVRDDGTAVNWRELHGSARQVMVKTAEGIALLDRERFLAEEVLS